MFDEEEHFHLHFDEWGLVSNFALVQENLILKRFIYDGRWPVAQEVSILQKIMLLKKPIELKLRI